MKNAIAIILLFLPMFLIDAYTLPTNDSQLPITKDLPSLNLTMQAYFMSILDRIATSDSYSTDELIIRNGYPYERHTVKTEDGFILQLHRIYHKTNNSNQTNRPVVYLQHGLFSTSTMWLKNSTTSLGYILYNNGFDVWMGDIRGNIYSNRHERYTTQDPEFWDWSYETIGKYDIPAIVGYITAYTAKPYLYYIGYSQGTLISFIGLLENQEAARRISINIALGPVAYMRHANPFAYFAGLNLTGPTLDSIMNLVIGYMGNKLNGTSKKNFRHYIQAMISEGLQKYDYGAANNTLHYRQPLPPKYNLSQILVPTMLFSGTLDPLSDPQDVSLLASDLPYLIGNIIDNTTGHKGLISGDVAITDFYPKIINSLKVTESLLGTNESTFNNTSFRSRIKELI